jgi:hypothetical protein
MAYVWPGAQWSGEQVSAATGALGGLTEPVDFVLGMAAMLHERSPEEVEAIGRALRCSNREIEDMTWLVGRQTRVAEALRLTLAEFKLLAAHPRFEDLLTLHRVISTMDGRSLEGYGVAVRLKKEIPPEELAPPPFITGEDLIAAGRQPGPEFKRILDALYTAQLNNDLRSRAEALRRLDEMLKT